jgi:hypothetical protein
VTANPVFQHGEPPVLFKRTPNASVHASTPDLNLFPVVILIAASGSAPEPFTVVLNWQAALKK